MNSHSFLVTMSCSGCSGAVERALRKLESVKDVKVSLEQQKVTVYTDSDTDTELLLETIKKTGKSASLLN